MSTKSTTLSKTLLNLVHQPMTMISLSAKTTKKMSLAPRGFPWRPGAATTSRPIPPSAQGTSKSTNKKSIEDVSTTRDRWILSPCSATVLRWPFLTSFSILHATVVALHELSTLNAPGHISEQVGGQLEKAGGEHVRPIG